MQRVSEAAVSVEGEELARIGPGLLVLLGVRQGDGAEQADRIAAKLKRLRIFEDAEGRMNLSVGDVGGEVLCVSQFTLYGDARKGNRPSFVEAAAPEVAEPLYERVRDALGARRLRARIRVSLSPKSPFPSCCKREPRLSFHRGATPPATSSHGGGGRAYGSELST